MAGIRPIIIAAALVSPIATIAQAADMPSLPMPTPPSIQRAVIDEASGWYLRGDVGYRRNGMGTAMTTVPFTDPIQNKLKSGAAFGGGVGLKASWVRADLTVDYGLPVNYTATTLAAGDTTAKVSALTSLLNVYFDLGTWSGFTPYLGAGVGAGYLRTANYASPGAPPFGTSAAYSRWNLAWAATGGVSYAFTRNLAVDVGYRYLNLGDAQTATDAFGKTILNNVNAHEVRLGLRWMFGDSIF